MFKKVLLPNDEQLLITQGLVTIATNHNRLGKPFMPPATAVHTAV